MKESLGSLCPSWGCHSPDGPAPPSCLSVCGSYWCCGVTRMRPGHLSGLNRHLPGVDPGPFHGPPCWAFQSLRLSCPSFHPPGFPSCWPRSKSCSCDYSRWTSPCSFGGRDLLLLLRAGRTACEPRSLLRPGMEEPALLAPTGRDQSPLSRRALWGLAIGVLPLVLGAGAGFCSRALGQASVLTPPHHPFPPSRKCKHGFVHPCACVGARPAGHYRHWQCDRPHLLL